jgi:hypothetical protein
LVWDSPSSVIIVIGFASSIFGSLFYTHPIMAINFPLREGRKKDDKHLAQGAARVEGLQGVLSAIIRDLKSSL